MQLTKAEKRDRVRSSLQAGTHLQREEARLRGCSDAIRGALIEMSPCPPLDFSPFHARSRKHLGAVDKRAVPVKKAKWRSFDEFDISPVRTSMHIDMSR